MASASQGPTQRQSLKVCANKVLGLPFPSLEGQGWDGLHKGVSTRKLVGSPGALTSKSGHTLVLRVSQEQAGGGSSCPDTGSSAFHR